MFGVKKLIHILTGWGKSLGILSTSSAEAKLSALRIRECMKCDYSEESKVMKPIGDELVDGYELTCKKCRCPCRQKSLVVDEECPIFKW